MTISAHDKNQLFGSIEKLFHYLMFGVTAETRIDVSETPDGENPVFSWTYRPPKSISISPTLYTRLDACHGAGNCCRVEFDLIYTEYDRQRIVDYDEKEIARQFGQESADRFSKNRDHLLASLVEMTVHINQTIPMLNLLGAGVSWFTKIYVKRNSEINPLSGNHSCPYLFIGGDRYFCGVHPFKPLHCWMPHMVVRAHDPEGSNEKASVLIGRMQYGRNHKFGCPVLFEESIATQKASGGGLFEELGTQGEHYFDKQFQDDIDKLEWVSKSAASLGFSEKTNFVVGIHEKLAKSRNRIQSCLAASNLVQIPLETRV